MINPPEITINGKPLTPEQAGSMIDAIRSRLPLRHNPNLEYGSVGAKQLDHWSEVMEAVEGPGGYINNWRRGLGWMHSRFVAPESICVHCRRSLLAHNMARSCPGERYTVFAPLLPERE